MDGRWASAGDGPDAEGWSVKEESDVMVGGDTAVAEMTVRGRMKGDLWKSDGRLTTWIVGGSVHTK